MVEGAKAFHEEGGLLLGADDSGCTKGCDEYEVSQGNDLHEGMGILGNQNTTAMAAKVMADVGRACCTRVLKG